jgi:hypothetical protein
MAPQQILCRASDSVSHLTWKWLNWLSCHSILNKVSLLKYFVDGYKPCVLWPLAIRVTCRWLQGGLERADFDYMVISGFEMSTTCRLHACDLRRWPSSYTGCSPDNAYTQSCVSFGKGWSLTGPQGSPSYESSPQTATTGYATHPIIFGPHPWTDRVDRHHMGRPFAHA